MDSTGSQTPHLERLANRLADDLSVESWGYAQLLDLSDERQRAVVSDQILTTTDAVSTNLREAGAHASAFNALVGPNGRAMPDPGRPHEVEDMQALDREMVGFFRASGSLLDCLAGATIGVLRLPLSIQRADAGALRRIADLAAGAEGDAATVWSRANDVIRAVLAESGPGWFEWTLEMRNAVVHRARQLRVWLPRATRQPGQAQVIVRTEQPAHRLIRYEPHFRRQPWMPDLMALSARGEASDNWLAEPATTTVRGVLACLEAMVEAMAELLLDVWGQTASGDVQLSAPSAEWPPHHGSPERRVAAASEFVGFEIVTAEVPLTAIVMNPRDAKRAQIAERLRTGQ
jgi:hypothetical protein